MRILFLTHYFPPEVNAPATRTFEHCRAWAAAGHDVHVVTCVPSHPAGVPFPGYRRCWYRRETLDGVHVHRVWTYLAPNRGVFRRTLNYLSFVPMAWLRSTKLGRFDVVVGTSPQFFCAVAAWAAAATSRAPWIFELRDLWPESIGTLGAVRSQLALRALENLELRLYKSAAAVVSVAEPFIENLRRRGVEPAKLLYVPNGVQPSFWEPKDRAMWRARLGVTEETIAVSYIGTTGLAHGLETLLDAARLLGDAHPHIRFMIVGDGAELTHLKARAHQSGLSNLHFTGMLPREEVVGVMAATDVVVVTLKAADTFKSVLPSKMLEAMAAGKPIVLAVSGEAQRILECGNGGVPVPPGDAAALASAVRTLAERPDERKRLGDAGAAYVAREFNRADWAKKYLTILEGIAFAHGANGAGVEERAQIRPVCGAK